MIDIKRYLWRAEVVYKSEGNRAYGTKRVFAGSKKDAIKKIKENFDQENKTLERVVEIEKEIKRGFISI